MTKSTNGDMTTHFLQKSSPELGRVLSKLHDKHSSYLSEAMPNDIERTELVSLIADLLSFDLSVNDTEFISDILMGLIKQAENDLRRAVAERLAVLENAPLRMVLHLANDNVDVATPILQKSRVLDDQDLAYIVMGQGVEHAREVAKRPTMSDMLIDILADTKDIQTAVNLSENRSITLTVHAFDVLFDVAKQATEVAEPLIQRHDISHSLAIKVYEFVGESLKAELVDEFGLQHTNAVAEAVDSAVAEQYLPTQEALKAVEIMLSQGRLNAEAMISTLKRGEAPSFVAMMSVYCGLSLDKVLKVLQQKNGKALAVVCKATGISKADFVNVFLLTAKFRKNRVVNPKMLNEAIEHYDSTSEETAKLVLAQERH